MKRLFLLFVLNLFLMEGAFAMPDEYKVVNRNENTGVCVVRDKYVRFGLTDKNSQLILPCEYSRIKGISDNLYITSNKELKDGLVNSRGEVILKPEFQIRSSRIEGTLQYSKPFDDNFGLIDIKTGKIIVQNIYTDIRKDAVGNYIVEKNLDQNQNGVLDREGKTIINPEYYFIMLMNGNKYYRLHKVVNGNDVYGVADINGKTVISTECTWIDKNPSSFEYEVVKAGKKLVFNSQNGSLK